MEVSRLLRLGIVSTVLLFSVSFAQESGLTCPPNFALYEDNCYSYIRDKLPYDQAQAACRAKGQELGWQEEVNLVTINDNFEENDFVASLVQRFEDEMLWIGFKRSTRPPFVRWEWISGETINFRNWGVGKPQFKVGNGINNCGAMDAGGDSGFWSDDDCNDRNSFVCETKPRGERDDDDCHEIWFHIGDSIMRDPASVELRGIPSNTQCMAECEKRGDGCKSISFKWSSNANEVNCYLSGKDRINSDVDVVPSVGWEYYENICEAATTISLSRGGRGEPPIPSSWYKASSFREAPYTPEQTELDYRVPDGSANVGYWQKADGDSNPWAGIHFQFVPEAPVTNIITEVRRIAIHGAGLPEDELEAYTMTFKLLYRDDDVNAWLVYKDSNGREKIFDGNTNRQGLKHHVLKRPIRAKFFAVRPLTFKNLDTFRWEVYGQFIEIIPTTTTSTTTTTTRPTTTTRRPTTPEPQPGPEKPRFEISVCNNVEAPVMITEHCSLAFTTAMKNRARGMALQLNNMLGHELCSNLEFEHNLWVLLDDVFWTLHSNERSGRALLTYALTSRCDYTPAMIEACGKEIHEFIKVYNNWLPIIDRVVDCPEMTFVGTKFDSCGVRWRGSTECLVDAHLAMGRHLEQPKKQTAEKTHKVVKRSPAKLNSAPYHHHNWTDVILSPALEHRITGYLPTSDGSILTRECTSLYAAHARMMAQKILALASTNVGTTMCRQVAQLNMMFDMDEFVFVGNKTRADVSFEINSIANKEGTFCQHEACMAEMVAYMRNSENWRDSFFLNEPGCPTMIPGQIRLDYVKERWIGFEDCPLGL